MEKYIRDVKAFYKYCVSEQIKTYGKAASKRMEALAIQKAHVISYKQWLTEHFKPASVNSMLAALNSFLRFCGWGDFAVKPLKIQRQMFASPERLLSRGEYMRLLNAAKKCNRRQLMMVMETLGATGMRVSELAFVTVEALKQGCITISCKGKIRKIFLPRKLCIKLRNYASSVNIRNGAIFISKSGRPLDRKNIWAAMKKLCGIAGVGAQKVFPHNLRHLFATLYYGLEKDIAKLADILGHSSINTTRLYILTDGMEHRKALERLALVYD